MRHFLFEHILNFIFSFFTYETTVLQNQNFDFWLKRSSKKIKIKANYKGKKITATDRPLVQIVSWKTMRFLMATAVDFAVLQEFHPAVPQRTCAW